VSSSPAEREDVVRDLKEIAGSLEHGHIYVKELNL
jgi:hypothetical protein